MPTNLSLHDLYTRAVDGAIPVVAGIDDTELDAATPCAEWDVRTLLNHLFDVVVQFKKAAAGGDLDFSGSPDYLVDDWRAEFATQARALIEAWDQPGVAEGQTSTGFPLALRARLAVCDLTVHGWDLAKATGQEFDCDAARAEELLGLMQQMAPMRKGSTAFAEEVEIAQTAPVFDKVLALSGRDPHWTA